MESFKNILPLSLKKINLDFRFKAESVIYHWQQIVGEDIFSHARPRSVQRGVLNVKVSNAVWSHHLMTLKDEIINKINAFMGEKVISDIKFQAGYFKNDQNEENTTEKDYSVINWKNIVLSEAEVKEIEKLAQNASEYLQEKTKKILRKDYALRKAKQKAMWVNCKKCGVLCPPDFEYCTVCAIEVRNKQKDEIRKILEQAPWLNFKECNQYVECRFSDFNAIKSELIDRLAKKIEVDENDQIVLMTLVMLSNEIKPTDVTKEMLSGMLDKVRRKKNVSASRR
jgi:hypothetical protein